MRFEYKRYMLPDGRAIARPVIPILIRNPRTNQAIHYEALVDSGADRCVFPSEIGKMIGIDIAAGEREFISGAIAAEGRPLYLHPVEITPGGYWASRILHLMAGFMPDLSDTGHGLLGHNGFFDNLSSVKFQSLKGILEIGARR
jgi:hypothetical protein